MTAKKDLKKRVRARQQQTGERYTAALARVRKQAPKTSRPSIREAPSLTTFAEAAGLTCLAYCSFPFWELCDGEVRSSLARGAFDRLVRVLRVTAVEPSTALLRAALLHGQLPRRSFAFWDGGQFRAFTERLRLGVRGTSEDGRTIAFEAPDPRGGAPLVVVAMLWPSRSPEPLLYLSLASEWLSAKPFLDVFVGGGSVSTVTAAETEKTR